MKFLLASSRPHLSARCVLLFLLLFIFLNEDPILFCFIDSL